MSDTSPRKIKKYKNGELKVVWEAEKCIHAAECVKRLPQVYDPKARPWIKAENASPEQLMEQIDACPSGALTYELEEGIESRQDSSGIEVDVLRNGPLMVKSDVIVTMASGESEHKQKRVAFCRCGASDNKPYCDGAHKRINFVG